MAEQERREPGSPDSPDGGAGREPEVSGAGQSPPDPQEEGALPVDEDAVWAQIVAGYGEEPPDPPGAKPFKSVEDLALLDPQTNAVPGREDRENPDEQAERPAADGRSPLGSSVSFAPGVGGAPGPRDHTVAEPSDTDFDEDDEGHFVPPEPPPLPESDVTARFAWLAVLGGPVLLLVSVLLGWSMTWWLATLCIGGFLGGFATLVGRMKSDEDEDDDPGRGAVV
ncbi:hypothetical protein [Streptomyces sp. NPDC049813]|uniref:hypothetical protein n=1 Tax=Streptomyces sp. NPDC049813 TaxID=3365597 RepID=UPI0037A34E1D